MDQSSSHIIIFDKENKVLVVKRSPDDEWGAGLWAIPGGKRESGESLLQNVQRETFEEVGLTLFPDKIKFMDNLSKKMNHCFFTTRYSEGEVKLGDGEHDEFKWIKLEELDIEQSVPNLHEEIVEAQRIMYGCIAIKIG